jgi:phage repressor protein C with HTH and peptisase S24 domain
MTVQTRDGVRQLVLERIDALHTNMKAVSIAAGLNHAYLQQFIRGATPHNLPEEVRERLAPILGVAPERLRGAPRAAAAGEAARPVAGPALAERPAAERSDVRPAPQVRLDRAASRPANIPVRGVVRGGAEGGFELNLGDAIEYVRRPLSLVGRGEVYALYVEGDSMAPRYEPGETILVYEQKPAVIGRDVVVQVRPRVEGDNPRAYLKRLVKRNSRDVVLEQFNPRKTMTLKAADIISIHLVLTRDEML